MCNGCLKLFGHLTINHTLHFRNVSPYLQGIENESAGAARPTGTGCRKQLLERGAVDDASMSPLCGHSIRYRIAVGSQAGRKVFSLQTAKSVTSSSHQFLQWPG
jgi:hypothetical protein